MGALEAGLVVGDPIGAQLIHHVHRLVAHLALLLCPHERHSSPPRNNSGQIPPRPPAKTLPPRLTNSSNRKSKPTILLVWDSIWSNDQAMSIGLDSLSWVRGGWDDRRRRRKAQKGGDFPPILAGRGEWVPTSQRPMGLRLRGRGGVGPAIVNRPSPAGFASGQAGGVK